LTYRTTNEEIKKKFRSFGKIVSFRFKGRYCFVEYSSVRSSDDAVKTCNGKDVFGEGELAVRYSTHGGTNRT